MKGEVVELFSVIDDREDKLMEAIDDRNLKGESNFYLAYEKKRLDIADIVISSRVGIERKAGTDLPSSIADNRLAEQLVRLREAYEYPILLIEGFNGIFSSNIRLSSIYGMLTKIAYKTNVGVIPTRDLEDTMMVIERIAFREQVKKKFSVITRSCPKGLDLAEQRAYFLEGMIKVGPKTASALISVFGTPINVLTAIKETQVTYTNTGKPKGIQGILKTVGIRGAGIQFVLKNQKLIFDLDENPAIPRFKGKVQQKLKV